MRRIISVAVAMVMLCILFGHMRSPTGDVDLDVRADGIETVCEEPPVSGSMKPNRAVPSRNTDVVTVMFDDAHFPAYTADPKNDADESVGGCAGGYSDFADVLRDPQGMSRAGHTFITDNTYEVISLDEGEKITDLVLEEVDVLVIPCSFNRYADSEIDAIERYVKGGGGLFLIADHSNFATAMDDIAWRFHVRWAHDVVTDRNDYSGGQDYWIIWEDQPPATGPGDDNMPANNAPGYQNDPEEIWKITQYSPTVQYYCSNAYTYENPHESIPVIITDTDGSSNFHGEPACLAIPNGNATGAGKAVFITDSNVFGDMWYDLWGNPDGDCDDDGIRDFWDEHNAEFGLGVIDWLAPGAYEVALIPGEKDPHSGLPKPLVYIYEPGETHTFDIEVWNLGLRADTIKLEIPEVPGNWSASLDKSETDELGKRESEHVMLTVTAPLSNVTDGDYAIINVTATSVGDPENATDTIHSTNVIIVDLGFNVNWAVKSDVNDQKKIIVDPGKTTVATLGFNNIGNINDTYRVKLEGVPSDWAVTIETSMNPGWVYDPEEKTVSGISLSSYHFEDNTTGVTVFFTPPVDAKEGETAIVTAMGESYLSLLTGQDAKGKHDDDLILEVSAYRAIDMYCDETVKYVDPGKSVSFLVSVQNNGNSKEKVDVQLGPLVSGWISAVDMPTVILQARQRKTVTVTMWAPEYALEGSRCVLEVKANMASVDKVVDSVFLTTIVNRYSMIDASLIDNDYYAVDPGEKISLNISVNNIGNGISGAFFSMAQLPMNWQFEFFFEGLPIDSILLDPFQTIQLRLDVTISQDALCDGILDTPGFDPYALIINVSGEENFEHLLVSVQINRLPSITVHTPDNLEITEPGDWALFYICIKNNGNAWDDVDLDIEDIPIDTDVRTEMKKQWVAYFSSVALIERVLSINEIEYVDFSCMIDVTPLTQTNCYQPNNTEEELLSLEEMTIRLPRNGIAWVGITVRLPHYAVARDESFNITTRCVTVPGFNIPDIGCIISIRNANLLIVGDIILPDDVVAGDLISVKVYIKNTGDIRAENVQIRLYEDGAPRDTMRICTILPGNTQLVAFTWRVPDKAECDLKVVVDPDNLIVEKDEQDNVRENSVTISSSSTLFLGLEKWVAGIIGGVIVILVLVVIFWSVRRKRLGY